MKRFYQSAAVAPAAPSGFEIRLDGKPIRTPARHKVVAPTERLAKAIAGEWNAQAETVLPDSMPLTQLLITVQERVREERATMQANILGYLDTDLLCYRASPPAPIAQRQRDLWDPWLAWFAEAYSVTLLTTEALTVVRQNEAAHRRVADAVQALDDGAFGALQSVAAATGSLVLALAAAAGAATPEDIFAALYAEEDFKAEFYREDFHGHAPHEEKRRAHILRDLCAARDFLDLLR